jgi:tellurite resistance protein
VSQQLLELYRGVAVHATADVEHQAALGLLALVMVADGTLDDEEVKVIRDLSDEWRDDLDVNSRFERYFAIAVEQARAAVAEDRVVELVDELDRRISSRVLRQALFSAARDVAGADDDVTVEEGSLLAEIAVRFG